TSTILLPYTEGSRRNLLAEGIPGDRVLVTGNPIREVILNFSEQIEESTVLENLGAKPFEYFLVTLHRAENVDLPERLADIFSAFNDAANKYEKDVLVSVHPRTAEKIKNFGIKVDSEKIKLLEPLGFF